MGVVMRILKALIPVLTLLAAAAPVSAENLTLTCRTNPSFLATMRRALVAKVQNEINTTLFTDSRAKVSLRLLSLQATNNSVNTDDLLSTVAVTDSGDPSGLAFALSGGITFANAGSCVYTYRVVVTTRGRDTVNGDRISTRTDSTLTVTTPPYGSIRKG